MVPGSVQGHDLPAVQEASNTVFHQGRVGKVRIGEGGVQRERLPIKERSHKAKERVLHWNERRTP